MDGQNLGPEDMQQLKQIEELKKQLMSKMLSKEAYERLGRVRAVNPELAGQVELYLIQVYQSGKLQDKISDRKMKDILGLLTQQKKTNFKIKRA